MAEHPPNQWLTDFLTGRLPASRAKKVTRHLLQGCDDCRKEISPIAEVMFRPLRAREPEEGALAAYDAPVDRVLTRLCELDGRLRRERRKAEGEIPKLLDLLKAGRELPEAPELWTRGLCEALLERSWELRYDDPQTMRDLADLARTAADRLSPAEPASETAERLAMDLRSRAWAEYANACRIVDDLAEAESAFSRALELCRQGTGAVLVRARLAELGAALLSHQRRFPAALQNLDLAHALYVRYGDPHDASRVLVARGIYTGRSGDPELGIRYLVQALERLSPERDAKLHFITLHNILLFRIERGEFREANLQLFQMRPMYARHAGKVDRVKLRWLEGRIAAGLGESERAERAFLYVRQEFEQSGQVYHAAVAALDLAALWLRRGRSDEVLRLASELLETFRSLYVTREIISALLTLRDAAQAHQVSHDLILLVASILEVQQEDLHRPGIPSVL